MSIKFAVIQNNTVVDVILADSVETANEATGLFCVQIEENQPIKIGIKYENNVFEEIPVPYYEPLPE